MSLALGDRIKLGAKYSGTIEYIGEIIGQDGIWVGMKLDKPLGTNNGAYNGTRYFYANEKHGLFARYTRLQKIKLQNYSENKKIENIFNSQRQSECDVRHENTDLKSLATNINTNDENLTEFKSADEKYSYCPTNFYQNNEVAIEEETLLSENRKDVSDNLFVRYDKSHMNTLKSEISKLKLELEKEKRLKLEDSIKLQHITDIHGKLVPMINSSKNRLVSAQNDIKELGILLRKFQSKIKKERDKGPLAQLVTNIILSIETRNIDLLNKSLQSYASEMKKRGIHFQT